MPVNYAAIETTLWSIEWGLAELVNHPETQQKLRREMDTVLGAGHQVTERDTHRLPYLQAVVKEALRLHPPAPLLVPRESIGSCELQGYTVPAKSRVVINVWAIGRDPVYWKDAEAFQPARFEDGAVDFTGNNFEFVPFGAGRRMCPGMAFGLANVELALARLLYHFDWELPAGAVAGELDMAEEMGVTVRRRHDLVLVPVARVPVPPNYSSNS